MAQVWLLCDKGSLATMFNGHTYHCFPYHSNLLWLLVGLWEFQQGFLPFILMDVSWTLFCFHFYCVDMRNLCMFVGRTLVLSLGPKLLKNLHNNDIGNEVYIWCEIATMTNEGNIYIGKTKTFQITKKNTSCIT
jgi:hypothetical protein